MGSSCLCLQEIALLASITELPGDGNHDRGSGDLLRHRDEGGAVRDVKQRGEKDAVPTTRLFLESHCQPSPFGNFLVMTSEDEEVAIEEKKDYDYGVGRV